MKRKAFCHLFTVAILGMAAVSCFSGEADGGFGIGPGLVIVENVKPGEATSTEFGVYNGGPTPSFFTVTVKKPSTVIGSWEHGYREIPDASWCTLSVKEVEVKPKSEAKIKLDIKVPDMPENWNSKFMAVVTCSPGKAQAGVVGLQVASRVQIETLADPGKSGTAAKGAIALIPSICEMWDVTPSSSWHVLVKVHNNTAEERSYTVKRLGEVEKDSAKHARYFCKGFEAIIQPGWIESGSTFSVKPGEFRQLNLKVSVPASVKAGAKYEELILLEDDKGKIEFVRARTEVAK